VRSRRARRVYYTTSLEHETETEREYDSSEKVCSINKTPLHMAQDGRLCQKKNRSHTQTHDKNNTTNEQTKEPPPPLEQKGRVNEIKIEWKRACVELL